MKKLLLAGVLALFLAGCSGKKFDAEKFRRFPSYEEVYAKAFSQYSPYSEKGTLLLARKPDGWYLLRLDREGQEKEQYLFWSADRMAYEPVHAGLEKALDASALAPPDPGQAAMFRVIPFYGYQQWPGEVIDQLEGETLNDTLMEALARAYGARAAQLSGLSHQLDGKGTDKMTQQQQDDFKAYMGKSIDTYLALYRKNPSYNTVVGNAQNKYSNECVYAWLSLSFFGDRGQAKTFLKDGLYTPFLVGYAKNILSSCDKNAILLTYGDNDYFPLLYVQQKLGWRTDVAVLNVNLMQLGNYIEKYSAEYGLRHNIPVAAYHDRQLDYVVIPASGNTVKARDIISDFAARKWKAYQRGTDYLQLPGNNLLFDQPGDTAGTYRVSFRSSYVLRNEVFLWDLLLSNGPARPVSRTNLGVWESYKPVMRKKAMVYTFVYGAADSSSRGGQLDTAMTEKMLLGTFTYDWNTHPTLTERSAANEYLQQFYELAAAYDAADKKEKALQVIHKAIQTFPQAFLPGHYVYYLMAKIMQRCGDEKAAIELAMAYVNGVDKLVKTLKGEDRMRQLRSLESITVLESPSGEWTRVVERAREILSRQGQQA